MQPVDLQPVDAAAQTQRPSDLFLIFAGANIVATTLQIGAWINGLPVPNAMAIIAAGAIAGAWLVAAFLAPAGSAARVGQRRFGDSLDMARQVVETIVDRRELLVRILVVIVAV